MAGFDTSDEEEEIFEQEFTPPQPFRLDWMNVPHLGLFQTLALSSLPGCRFREHRRNLGQDIAVIRSHGITDVFILMMPAELRKFRVPTLLQEYERQGVYVHHYTVQDGGLPSEQDLMQMVLNLQSLTSEPRTRVLVHCYGGLGRTGLLVACFLLSLDSNLHPETAISFIRATRGPRAIQTVRQWNFVHEFRRIEKEFYENEKMRGDRSRSVSR